jgi:archaemetzincin
VRPVSPFRLTLWALPVLLAACEHPPAPARPAVVAASAALAVAANAAPAPAPPAPGPPAPATAPASRPAPASAPARLVVELVPLRNVPAAVVDEAARGLRARLPVDVVVAPRLPLPAAARVGATARYRADRLLDELEQLPGAAAKVMGVAAVDIVTRKGRAPNWGVLGLGSLDGRTAVVSTFRMRRGATEERVRERRWKTVLHELGHTFGLDHCPTPGCIMEDARGTVATSDREHALCPACAARFAAAVGAP